MGGASSFARWHCMTPHPWHFPMHPKERVKPGIDFAVVGAISSVTG